VVGMKRRKGYGSFPRYTGTRFCNCTDIYKVKKKEIQNDFNFYLIYLDGCKPITEGNTGGVNRGGK